jgi:hypothetical protein
LLVNANASQEGDWRKTCSPASAKFRSGVICWGVESCCANFTVTILFFPWPFTDSLFKKSFAAKKFIYGLRMLSKQQGDSKKSFANLKACINVFRGHVQCFELPYCSKRTQLYWDSCGSLWLPLALQGVSKKEALQ